MTAPPRLEFDVPCPPDRAFDLWTNRTDLWWPPAYTASGRKGTKIVFEPRAGGRVYEQAPDGSQTDWGHVLEWAPPARLIYRWHLFSDPTDATEVEVQFLATTGGSTRVRLEHRGWDAFADGAARRNKNQTGWRQALRPLHRRLPPLRLEHTNPAAKPPDRASRTPATPAHQA